MKKYIRGRVQKTMAGFEEPAPTMKKKRKLSSTPAATSFSRAEDEGAGLLALVDAAKRKGPLTHKKQKTKSKKHANLKWTAEEDKKLAELVKQYECKQWKEVASHFPNEICNTVFAALAKVCRSTTKKERKVVVSRGYHSSSRSAEEPAPNIWRNSNLDSRKNEHTVPQPNGITLLTHAFEQAPSAR